MFQRAKVANVAFILSAGSELVRSIVPNYFLHMADGSTIFRDPDGGEFDSVALAIEEAGATAREVMARDLMAGQRLGAHRSVVIEDESGSVVAVLKFAAALLR